MKSLFEQFGGIYQKESEYAIPNLRMPDTEKILKLVSTVNSICIFHYNNTE